jgi:hypothetical protein
MASTRAKARALRDMDDIGMTCLEELGDLDEVLGEEASGDLKPKKNAPKKIAKAPEPQAAKETKAEKGDGSNGGNGGATKQKTEEPKPKSARSEPTPDQPAPMMSSAQKNAIYNLSRRRGISVEELEKMAQQNYGVPLESLSSANASAFIRTLQQSA